VSGLTSISGSLLSVAHPLEVTQHGDARTKPPLAIACSDGCRVLVALAINEAERHSREPLRFGLAPWHITCPHDSMNDARCLPCRTGRVSSSSALSECSRQGERVRHLRR
jgi:hypothetical protein